MTGSQPYEALAGMRVLVVEDGLILAMDIEEMLQDLRCEVAGTTSTVAEALRRIAADMRLDGALIDLNLRGTSSLPVVEMLADRRIPFILTTGYDARASDPAALRDAPRLRKPFSAESLAGAMMTAFLAA